MDHISTVADKKVPLLLNGMRSYFCFISISVFILLRNVSMKAGKESAIVKAVKTQDDAQ